VELRKEELHQLGLKHNQEKAAKLTKERTSDRIIRKQTKTKAMK
jgi:hypothetical protein